MDVQNEADGGFMNSALRQRENCPSQTRLNRVVKNKLKKHWKLLISLSLMQGREYDTTVHSAVSVI